MKIEMIALFRQVNYVSLTMNQVANSPKRRGRPRSFDRDAALDSAMRLFWRRGYEATSVNDLTEAMGITPPSLYGAFGDKKRLFMEAVTRYQTGRGCFAAKALTEEPTAEGAIRCLLHGAVKSFSNPSDPRGCLIVLGAINCAVESNDVMNALAERRRMAESAVRARITAGAAAGELAPNADVDTLTGLVVTTLYGLAIRARDGVSPASLRKTVAQVMEAWPRRKVGTR